MFSSSASYWWCYCCWFCCGWCSSCLIHCRRHRHTAVAIVFFFGELVFACFFFALFRFRPSSSLYSYPCTKTLTFHLISSYHINIPKLILSNSFFFLVVLKNDNDIQAWSRNGQITAFNGHDVTQFFWVPSRNSM